MAHMLPGRKQTSCWKEASKQAPIHVCCSLTLHARRMIAALRFPGNALMLNHCCSHNGFSQQGSGKMHGTTLLRMTPFTKCIATQSQHSCEISHIAPALYTIIRHDIQVHKFQVTGEHVRDEDIQVRLAMRLQDKTWSSICNSSQSSVKPKAPSGERQEPREEVQLLRGKTERA